MDCHGRMLAHILLHESDGIVSMSWNYPSFLVEDSSESDTDSDDYSPPQGKQLAFYLSRRLGWPVVQTVSNVRCLCRRKQMWRICAFLTPPLLPSSFTAPLVLPHALHPNIPVCVCLQSMCSCQKRSTVVDCPIVTHRNIDWELRGLWNTCVLQQILICLGVPTNLEANDVFVLEPVSQSVTNLWC